MLADGFCKLRLTLSSDMSQLVVDLSFLESAARSHPDGLHILARVTMRDSVLRKCDLFNFIRLFTHALRVPCRLSSKPVSTHWNSYWSRNRLNATTVQAFISNSGGHYGGN